MLIAALDIGAHHSLTVRNLLHPAVGDLAGVEQEEPQQAGTQQVQESS